MFTMQIVVIVFDEHGTVQMRIWVFGDSEIKESVQCTHLGVVQSKSQNNLDNVVSKA